MSVADYVTPGRCLCCGSRKLAWSPEAIVEACKAFHAEHGRTPVAKDWNRSAPTHPSRTTALYVFGTWNNMLRAADLFGRSHGGWNWSREDVAEMMLDELLRTGAWPTWHGWRLADPERRRPTAKTVVGLFGSWAAAKRFAGWDGSHPNAKRPEIVEPRCTGCGAEFENTTLGCTVCWDRKHRRERRASTKSASASRLAAVEAAPDTRSARSGGTPSNTTSDREADAPAVEKEAA